MREEVQASLRQDIKRRGPLERSSALDTKQRGPSQVTVGSPVKDIEQKKTSSAALWTNYQSEILACWRASEPIGGHLDKLENIGLIWEIVTCINIV